MKSIRKVAEEVSEEWYWDKDERIGDCIKLSEELKSSLEEKGFTAEQIEGKIRGEWGDTTRHFFVLVEEENTEYIVDLSLCQFTKENAEEFGWDIWIEEKNIPEVIVTKKGERFYDYYVM